MSVALLVTFKPDAVPSPGADGDLCLPMAPQQRFYLPVAAQKTFVDHWVPLAQTLGLEFVPLFKTGTILGIEDLPYVIGELELLAAHAPANHPAMVDGRARKLPAHLRALDPDAIQEIFIG